MRSIEVVPNIFILLLKEGALFSLFASAQSIDGNRLRVHEIRHLQRWSIILTEHVFAYIYLWLPHKASVSFKLCVIIWVSKKSAVKMSIILMVLLWYQHYIWPCMRFSRNFSSPPFRTFLIAKLFNLEMRLFNIFPWLLS